MKKYGFSRMNEEQALVILHALRAAADRGEREYISALIEVESEGSFWRAGDATFENYLTRTDLCGPDRYARGKLALELVKSADIDVMGIEAAMQVVRIENPKKRETATFDLVAAAEKQGQVISERHARNVVERFLPYKPSVASKQKLEIEALRRRVKELEVLVATYRERFGDLGLAQGGKKGTSRKAEGNTTKSVMD